MLFDLSTFTTPRNDSARLVECLVLSTFTTPRNDFVRLVECLVLHVVRPVHLYYTKKWFHKTGWMPSSSCSRYQLLFVCAVQWAWCWCEMRVSVTRCPTSWRCCCLMRWPSLMSGQHSGLFVVASFTMLRLIRTLFSLKSSQVMFSF